MEKPGFFQSYAACLTVLFWCVAFWVAVGIAVWWLLT